MPTSRAICVHYTLHSERVRASILATSGCPLQSRLISKAGTSPGHSRKSPSSRDKVYSSLNGPVLWRLNELPNSWTTTVTRSCSCREVLPLSELSNDLFCPTTILQNYLSPLPLPILLFRYCLHVASIIFIPHMSCSCIPPPSTHPPIHMQCRFFFSNSILYDPHT